MSTETTTYVAPTSATATVEPTSKANAKHDMPPALSLRLPPECQPAKVGQRIVWSTPQYMEHEASEWNAVQYAIQELLERRPKPDPTEAPKEAGIDVMGASTTREQLRRMGGSAYHIQTRDSLEHFRELGGLEKRLLRIIWESERIEFLRRIAAAGAAVDRTNRARERLRTEAPQELHDRLKELDEERRHATYEILDDGGSGANMVAWYHDQIQQAERALSPESKSPPHHPAVVKANLRDYRRNLAEREEKLALIEAEAAEIEARMIAE